MGQSSRRRLTSVVIVGLLIAAPVARADHALSTCDNGEMVDTLHYSRDIVPGVATVEIHIGTSQDSCISVDLLGTSLDTLVGVDLESGSMTVVCVRAPVAGNHHVIVDSDDRGLIRLWLCTFVGEPEHGGVAPCTVLLDWTGVRLNTGAPLFSCVWVNNVQQNPGCP